MLKTIENPEGKKLLGRGRQQINIKINVKLIGH
jgi:hypothetical protein